MIDFKIDDMLKEMDGKYNLVHLVVNRVRKLKSGVEPKVERRMREEDIVLAIREIDSGSLTWDLESLEPRHREVELGETIIGTQDS
jgi:DNA-directed RNA polymerase omega subunit